MEWYLWVIAIVWAIGFLFFAPWFIGMAGIVFTENMTRLTKIYVLMIAVMLSMFWPFFIIAIILTSLIE